MVRLAICFAGFETANPVCEELRLRLAVVAISKAEG